MRNQRYDTELTDEQFALLEAFLPRPKRTGRPPADLRQVLNAILYLVRTGCQWRLLPHDFPPWSTVHTWYRRWRQDGTWERINEALRQQVRRQAGRDPSPRASAVDSQSVKTAGQGGPKGYDAGKKVSGRKRHIVVDTLGLILAVVVHAADVQDRDGARLVLAKLAGRFPRLRLIWADGGYGGQLVTWALAAYGWALEIVKRPDDARGFVALPKRWLVERTFGWLGRCRRLSKDYEARPETCETWIYPAMTHLMLRRLKPT